MKRPIYEKGMYVRCPFDDESINFPRMFITGKIILVEDEYDEVTVRFNDLSNLKQYIATIPNEMKIDTEIIEHVKIQEETKVLYWDEELKLKKGIIIDSIKTKENNFYYYYIQVEGSEAIIEKVREDDIDAPLEKGKITPVTQMINYELQNPVWYLKRNVVSRFFNTLINAPDGFETLVGARAYLFPHQIDTIMRASREEYCRLMLADEVGLGKTIEALIIAEQLRKKKKDFRTIVIVPEALINQWINEFEIKLWIKIDRYSPEIEIKNHVIISLEKVHQIEYRKVISQKWDLMIVDEVHNILNNDLVYDEIYKLSERIPNVLILSATPIVSRRTEYLKLLRLLKPYLYGKMTEEEFDELVQKNAIIKENVCDARNALEDYYQEGGTETGYLEDVVDCLENISEEVNDSIIETLINQINPQESEKAVGRINMILAYIAEYFQIDRDIIRHRRSELKERFAERKLIKKSYTMLDRNMAYYEYETYLEVIACINKLKKEPQTQEIMEELINSMFSSPYALTQIIDKYQLSKYVDVTELNEYLEDYTNAVDEEISQIQSIIDEGNIKGRNSVLADFIDQEAYDKKTVVFSKYTITAEKAYEMFCNLYEKDKITRFYSGMSQEELAMNIELFQTNEDIKLLVCDYLAGEGRNLQEADFIVHIDLPISPNDIEQRIGRLDRIGRSPEKDVISVVIYTEDTLEEQLLRIWDECLHIFSESLSGLEIALKELKMTIVEFIANNDEMDFEEEIEIFKDKVKKLNRTLREERLNDVNRQLSKQMKNLLENLIEEVDKGEGQLLGNVMKAWGKLVGMQDEDECCRGVWNLTKYTRESFRHGSFRKAWYIPPTTEKILERSNKPNEIRGTFSREQAIKNESIAFFAPGEPIFDSILKHAMNSYQGTCSAMQFERDFSFTGFIINWKTSFNKRILLENNIPLHQLNHIKGYEISRIETDLVTLSCSKDITQEEIESLMINAKPIHMGKRGGSYSNIEAFIEMYPPELWRKKVNSAVATSKKHIEEKVDKRMERCIKQFSLNFQIALEGESKANIYYNKDKVMNDQELLKKCLLAGIKNRKLEVDSIIYIRVVER